MRAHHISKPVRSIRRAIRQLDINGTQKLLLGGWELMALVATAFALFDLPDALYLFCVAIAFWVIARVCIPLNDKFSHYRAFIWLMFALFVVVAGVFTVNKANDLACPSPPVVGPLLPSDFPTPPNACMKGQTMATQGPIVAYASGGTMFSPGQQHVSIFRSGDHDLVSVDVDKNGVASFNAELYDATGLLLAKIDKNQPTALGRDLCVQRPDLSTLEVKRRRPFRRAKELLFFQYLNAHAFKIRGVFSFPHHPTLEVTDKALDLILGPRRRIQLDAPCLSYSGTAFSF